MRVSIVASVVLWCGIARAEFSQPIVVKSAVASGAKADKEAWKVVATGDGHWCQAKLTPSETYTIELAAAAPVASVVLAVDKSIASAEIAVDGTSFKGTYVAEKLGAAEMNRGTITIKLDAKKPARKLVIAVSGNGQGCVDRIDLGAQVVYGTNASTLWADVAAIKAALVACDKQQIDKAFTFPFRIAWNTMDDNGMKEAATKYSTADKLKGGCQNVHVVHAIMKLDAPPKIRSTSATTLDVVDDNSATEWHLVLVNGHWRARGFNLGS